MLVAERYSIIHAVQAPSYRTDPMQLVDELSMIYTTCLMSYASLSYKRSGTFRVALAVSLISLSLFITLYYHYLQDPTFHQVAYAVLTVFVFFRSIYVMEVSLRTRFQSKQRRAANARSNGSVGSAVQRTEDSQDLDILREMWTMIGFGLSVFLGGFAVWQLDNIYCSTLRRWRHQVGLPWGVVLEGHGWW
jgi:dihydroceramidase